MGQVFAAFGIDWRLLVINSINFGLLLIVLWKFLYGPLTNMLNERREKIAQGVADAEAAKAQLAAAEESRAAVLAAAGKEADDVLARARKAGMDKEHEIIGAAESTAAHMIKDAEAASAELKAQALAESKQEVAKLIVLGVAKTINEPAHAGH